MSPLITLVVSMAIATWILIVLASLIRARAERTARNATKPCGTSALP